MMFNTIVTSRSTASHHCLTLPYHPPDTRNTAPAGAPTRQPGNPATRQPGNSTRQHPATRQPHHPGTTPRHHPGTTPATRQPGPAPPGNPATRAQTATPMRQSWCRSRSASSLACYHPFSVQQRCTKAGLQNRLSPKVVSTHLKTKIMLSLCIKYYAVCTDTTSVKREGVGGWGGPFRLHALRRLFSHFLSFWLLVLRNNYQSQQQKNLKPYTWCLQCFDHTINNICSMLVTMLVQLSLVHTVNQICLRYR